MPLSAALIAVLLLGEQCGTFVFRRQLVERQRVCFGNRIAQHLSFQQHQRLGFGKFERYLKGSDR